MTCLSLPISNRHPAAVAAGLLFANLIGAPLTVSAQNAPNEKGSQACRSDAEELVLKKKEQAQLGLRHAAEHAAMRSAQCEVQKGLRAVPAKGLVKPAKDTLAEDEALKQSVLAKMEQISIASRLASASRPSKPGKNPLPPPPPPPPPPEATLGHWSDPFVIPVVGVSSVVLHTGKLLFWSYDPATYHDPAASNIGVSYIWDPVSRQGRSITPPENIWCGGQTLLSDGRVYVAGGNLRYPNYLAPTGTQGWQGALSNYTFNPLSEKWARQPDMLRGRWYPTLTRLSDNRVVITSGYDELGGETRNTSVEVFTPDPNLDGSAGTIQAVGTHDFSGLYPQQFLLPSGKVLEAGPNAGSTNTLDPANWNWAVSPYLTSDHYNYGNGVAYTNASVSPTRQVIMQAGGTNADVVVANNEWTDSTNLASGWKPFPQWSQARKNANTVLLPDGSMLTVGGNTAGDLYASPVFRTELYSKSVDDTSGVWLTVAPHAVQAAYHSTAVLLPDATVLLSQDDMDSSAAAAMQHKAQVFSPPYLYRGAQPKILSAPTAVKLGESFSVTTDRTGMSGAVLVAPGATTHGNDMNQRVIKLPTQALTNGLMATVPASSSLLPAGYYMLFVLDSAGIPSVAKFVRVS